MAGLQLQIIEPQENEEGITDRQRAFIKSLCKEVGASFPPETLDDLGKWQASSIIDQLQSFKAELNGEEPLDTSRLTGLDDVRSAAGQSPTRTPFTEWARENTMTLTFIVVGIFLLILSLPSLLMG